MCGANGRRDKGIKVEGNLELEVVQSSKGCIRVFGETTTPRKGDLQDAVTQGCAAIVVVSSTDVLEVLSSESVNLDDIQVPIAVVRRCDGDKLKNGVVTLQVLVHASADCTLHADCTHGDLTQQPTDLPRIQVRNSTLI
jgi:hypothetical protein